MFDITNVMTNVSNSIEININVDIPKEYLEKASILELKDVTFVGSISKVIDYYNIKGLLKGIMILPDDVTLERVSIPFRVEIDTDFWENFETDENNLIIFENNIDLISFLWQNIVLEVPSKVRGKKDEEITLEGDGWRLMTEDEYNKGNNLGLSELKTLLDKRKEWYSWQYHLEKLVKLEEIWEELTIKLLLMDLLNVQIVVQWLDLIELVVNADFIREKKK